MAAWSVAPSAGTWESFLAGRYSDLSRDWTSLKDFQYWLEVKATPLPHPNIIVKAHKQDDPLDLANAWVEKHRQPTSGNTVEIRLRVGYWKCWEMEWSYQPCCCKLLLRRAGCHPNAMREMNHCVWRGQAGIFQLVNGWNVKGMLRVTAEHLMTDFFAVAVPFCYLLKQRRWKSSVQIVHDRCLKRPKVGLNFRAEENVEVATICHRYPLWLLKSD